MSSKIADIGAVNVNSPKSQFILTGNSEENRPMLDVNETIGLMPITHEGVWKKMPG